VITGDVLTSDRRVFLRRSLVAGGGLAGGRLAAWLIEHAVVPVSADIATDVQMLQTAASIENLAASVYTQGAALPADTGGASNPVIAQFLRTAVRQHTDDAATFNAAATALGGRAQTAPDATLARTVVSPALAQVTTPAALLGLLQHLEDVAAQTFVAFGATAASPQVIGPMASTASVAAQRSAFLSVFTALLDAGAPLGALALPPVDLGALPAALGAVGIPAAFHRTDAARRADEGAVA
jgi:hypothetical protein